MATWHKAADPLLNSDIPSLAATASAATHVCAPGEDLGAAMAAAVAATRAPGSAGASRVVTLIVPHDLSWQRGRDDNDAPLNGQGQGAASNASAGPLEAAPAGGLAPAAQRFVREAAAALQACPRGKAALYIGGRAALAAGERRKCRQPGAES